MEEEHRLITDVRIDESRVNEILAKQGQKKQFASVEERDRILRQQIRDKAGLISDNQEQVTILEKEMEDNEKEEERLDKEIGVSYRLPRKNKIPLNFRKTSLIASRTVSKWTISLPKRLF